MSDCPSDRELESLSWEQRDSALPAQSEERRTVQEGRCLWQGGEKSGAMKGNEFVVTMLEYELLVTGFEAGIQSDRFNL